MYLNSGFFLLSIFFRIRTESGYLLNKSLYSVQMRGKNRPEKTLNPGTLHRIENGFLSRNR